MVHIFVQNFFYQVLELNVIHTLILDVYDLSNTIHSQLSVLQHSIYKFLTMHTFALWISPVGIIFNAYMTHLNSSTSLQTIVFEGTASLNIFTIYCDFPPFLINN